jgi:hypothetical protein
MAKVKTLEQYISEMSRAEEIEKEINDMGTPVGKDVEDVEDEADEVQANESEEYNTDDESGDIISVSEMLETCYSKVKEEAKVWESDAHDDHTIETYMIENAALVASLAANTLKEMKEDSESEAHEACLNQMIEAYTKKINEMKESSKVPSAEEEDIE